MIVSNGRIGWRWLPWHRFFTQKLHAAIGRCHNTLSSNEFRLPSDIFDSHRALHFSHRGPAPAKSKPTDFWARRLLALASTCDRRSRAYTLKVQPMTSRAGGPLRRPGVSKSRLPNDSVVNVSQLMTLDKSVLTEKVSRLPAESLREVEAGIKLVLALQ